MLVVKKLIWLGWFDWVDMAKMKKQQYAGIVYSTDDTFQYQVDDDLEEVVTLEKHQQNLTVLLDKKARKGKMVTLVKGFIGTADDLDALAKILKQKCAVGGSSKDGEIIIQGDFREKIAQFLQQSGYKTKLLK